VGEDLIVESKVIAGDDIDACLLLDVPVLETESLGFGEEVSLRELAAPVSFGCFLQFAVGSHAGETEDRSVIGIEISVLKLKEGSARVATYD
jgi:hypothetical protein